MKADRVATAWLAEIQHHSEKSKANAPASTPDAKSSGAAAGGGGAGLGESARPAHRLGRWPYRDDNNQQYQQLTALRETKVNHQSLLASDDLRGNSL